MPTEHAGLIGAWKLGETQLGYVQAGVPQPTLPADTVNIITVTQTAIAAYYNTLAGNQPGANSNTLFLWPISGAQIPWNIKPYGQTSLTANYNPAAANINANIYQSGYIVGYAVGSTVGNIVATSFIQNTSNPPTTTNFVPSLSLYQPPTSTVINLIYSIPQGSKPLTNNHWIGIYTGQNPTFGSFPDAAVTNIPADNANTSVGIIPNPPLTAGAYYTAAYFAGGYNSTTPTSSKVNSMCALVCFQVPSS
jgi:hypothetical protein